MGTILTIGYEGSRIEDFLATLKVAEIEVLVDVRDVPVSRKRGFSKRALATALEDIGIQYVHLRDLGNPKSGREAARRGDAEAFENIFRSHLECPAAQAALAEVVQIASNARACLLCFEREPSCCHRAIVAEAVAERVAFQVLPLGVRHGLAKDNQIGEIGNRYACAVG